MRIWKILSCKFRNNFSHSKDIVQLILLELQIYPTKYTILLHVVNYTVDRLSALPQKLNLFKDVHAIFVSFSDNSSLYKQV
jgi:hypothetical protein